MVQNLHLKQQHQQNTDLTLESVGTNQVISSTVSIEHYKEEDWRVDILFIIQYPELMLLEAVMLWRTLKLMMYRNEMHIQEEDIIACRDLFSFTAKTMMTHGTVRVASEVMEEAAHKYCHGTKNNLETNQGLLLILEFPIMLQ